MCIKVKGDIVMKRVIASLLAVGCSLSTLQAAQDWERVLEFGPIRDVSIALYDIDNDGKDEIFIGTSKGLDANLNEIRPAGLICLEDDGSIKWTQTFPGMYDVVVGKSYNTTSVSTTPFFTNIDGGAYMEILVGVGGDTIGEAPGVMGQPGDKGGVYALDHNGNILWYHESLDSLGGEGQDADGRPNGVYGTPIAYDIDKDGKREVVINGWDQYVTVLDAQSGAIKLISKMHDSVWSTPKIADINNDGRVEMLISADITENPVQGTQTGGIFHVISPDGGQNSAGFNTQVDTNSVPELKGKYETQALWSSPQVGDIDNDGFLEIIYGTSNFFKDGRGEYVRVWNHDGSEKFVLPTIGRTFASPLVADIDNDGNLDIVEGTLDGHMYAWNGSGNQIFGVQHSINPLFGAPIAVDIDNDGRLEIIYADGAQITMLNASGQKINSELEYVVYFYKGAPAVQDIDKDGTLDLVSGGTTSTIDQAVVRKWSLPGSSTNARVGRSQYIGSNKNIQDFTSRFYKETLGRSAEPAGLNYWTDSLSTGILSGADLARSFIYSDEFLARGTSDEEFLDIMYSSFFNRAPDSGGYNFYISEMQNGVSREDVLESFLLSLEFENLCREYNIRAR